jgi:hypothetical protein
VLHRLVRLAGSIISAVNSACCVSPRRLADCGKPNKIIAFDLATSPHSRDPACHCHMTETASVSLSELVRMALFTGVVKSEE